MVRRLASVLLLLVVCVDAGGCRHRSVAARQRRVAEGEGEVEIGGEMVAAPTTAPLTAGGVPSGAKPRAAARAEGTIDPAPVAVAAADGGATLNGNPGGPKVTDFNAVVQGAMPNVQRCTDGKVTGAGQFDVRYRVLPDGKVTDVTVAGAPEAVADCVKGVAAAMQFPAFQGAPVSGTLPVTYRTSP